MKYKSIDLFLQVLFTVIFCATNFSENAAIPSWIPGYSIIAVAVVQIISLLIHANIKNVAWKELLLRKIHLIGIAVVLLMLAYGYYGPPNDKYETSIDMLVYSMYVATFLTVFYIVITFLEWLKMKKLQKVRE